MLDLQSGLPGDIIKRLSRPIVWIVLLQGACLGLGLWIHDRFIVTSAQWNAEVAAGDEMRTETADYAQRLLSDAGDNVQVISRHLSEVPAPAGTVAILADRGWNLVAASPDSGYAAGEFVGWRQSAMSADGPNEALRGLVRTAAGDRVAIAYLLPERQACLIVFKPDFEVRPDAAAMIGSLPMSSLLAFAWIFGLQAIVAHLILSRVHVEHAKTRTKSNEETMRRTQDLVRTRDAVIFGLAKLAESRDPETGHHLERISLYSTCLASALREHPKFRHAVTPQFVKLIGISSALHDIGKVGTEDAILLKPGRLTPEERTKMQQHSQIGGECLKQIERRLANSNFLGMAREIALYHHERWDGAGYPHGLSGEQIPLAARIVSIADVYDALSVRRCYKDAYPHETCVEMIREQAGAQFDPDLVEVFMRLESQFREIASRFGDTAAHSAKPAEPVAPVVEDTPSIPAEEFEELVATGAAARRFAVEAEVALALAQAGDGYE
jgi:putative two-component system response regulator